MTSSDKTLPYPVGGTTALQQVLSLPYATTSRVAQYFRMAGRAEIPSSYEGEHGFVLNLFIPLALQHGEGWQLRADALVEEVRREAVAAADVRRQAREAEAASQAEVADMKPPTD